MLKNKVCQSFFFFSIVSLAACGVVDHQESSELAERAATVAPRDIIVPITKKPDLVAEIVSGKACPVNSRDMVYYRVKNIGKATSPRSALRLRIRYQGNVSYWYHTADITINSLAPGESTTQGYANDRWDTLRFYNGNDNGARVTDWSIMVDDSGSAVESNEKNNLLNAAGQCFAG